MSVRICDGCLLPLYHWAFSTEDPTLCNACYVSKVHRERRATANVIYWFAVWAASDE